MIRPTTTLDQQASPVGSLFIFLELLAIVAVPVLGYLGSQALLDSRAGNFLSEPGPDDPGYRVLVDPSPVTAVVETVDGRVGGLVILTQPASDESGGGVVVVPAELEIDGRPLADRTPDEAVASVASLLKLRLPTTIVLDADGWALMLGDAALAIDNPDPVMSIDGSVTFAVGPLMLDASSIEDYLAAVPVVAPGQDTSGVGTGQSYGDDPQVHLYRRTLVWDQLVHDPPDGASALAATLRSVGSGIFRVESLPTEGNPPQTDSATLEELVREIVPFPAGSAVGDRLRVRVLGDPASMDIAAEAADVAGLGVEVVELGNVGEGDGSEPTLGFSDQQDTRSILVVPSGLDDSRVNELADALHAEIVVFDGVVEDDGILTLIVGGALAGS